MKHDPQTVFSAASWLEEHLADIPDIDIRDLERSRTRHHAACNRLIDKLEMRENLHARVSEKPAQGWALTMLGLRATSTSGFTGACRNWIAQARRKAQAELEGADE